MRVFCPHVSGVLLRGIHSGIFALLLLVLPGCGTTGSDPEGSEAAPPSQPALPQLEYVGTELCETCHPDEAELRQGSHHDLAMQPATEETVLGDFNNRQFRYHGITSTFFRKEGGYWVRTDGPDGRIADFPIAYTFGVFPLQQYLIEFSDGRIQALSICWDSRSRSEGGQRWFHLYPDEAVNSEDELHWTGLQQNWNFMCAECHSTNLQKNFDPVENRFNTSWSEIDVSCEACHGPASGHLAWLDEENEVENSGFPISLKRDVNWALAEGAVIAHQEVPVSNEVELNVCAQCHSRREAMTDQRHQGQSLLQSHRPSLLEPGLYFADGQIQDEVYEWGSFLQSKMYQAGVACSDCHNPHSLQVFGGTDHVCLVCHDASAFNSPEHHFHSEDSPGARCVSCHMPSRTYMQIDDRRDHSFRIPRPDLSVALGTPNACNSCHDDESPAWAAARLKEWYPDWDPPAHYGETLHAAQSGLAGAADALARLASDPERPGIVRATAFAQMLPPLGTGQNAALRSGLQDADPLVRWGALQAATGIAPEARVQVVSPLLTDPVRAVREQAGLLLASVPSGSLRPDQQSALSTVLAEYRASQQFNDDRPESHFNQGIVAHQRGQIEEAERHYQKSLGVDPRFVPALINLVDLYKDLQREDEGERLLRLGLSVNPQSPETHFALGLLLVRTGRPEEGLSSLKRAVELQPQSARFSYVYAVSLEAAGRRDEALAVLRRGIELQPTSRELLMALVTTNRDAGNIQEALQFLERLIALEPGDSQLRALQRQLQSR